MQFLLSNLLSCCMQYSTQLVNREMDNVHECFGLRDIPGRDLVCHVDYRVGEIDLRIKQGLDRFKLFGMFIFFLFRFSLPTSF